MHKHTQVDTSFSLTRTCVYLPTLPSHNPLHNTVLFRCQHCHFIANTVLFKHCSAWLPTLPSHNPLHSTLPSRCHTFQWSDTCLHIDVRPKFTRNSFPSFPSLSPAPFSVLVPLSDFLPSQSSSCCLL